jgi:hypothetical protein
MNEIANGRRTNLPPSANGTNGRTKGAAPPPSAPPSNTVATAGPATPDRGADGRFTPGNRAAAGNAFHRAVAARRKALLDAVSAGDVAAVGRKLLEQALGGDVAASKVLLAYVVGKPAPAADPDRLDLDELRAMLERPFRAQLVLHALEAVDPAPARDFLAGGEPLTAEKIIDSCKGSWGAKELLALKDKATEARAKRT